MLVGESEQMLSFEGASLPEGFITGPGSVVVLNDRRRINGQQSLQWLWQEPGATIEVQRPIAYVAKAPPIAGQPAGTMFSLWVYNESPLAESMRVEFGRGAQVDCWFDFRLNFSGWRTAWVSYDRDMQGQAVEGMDSLRLRAPETIAGHRLFIDRIILANPVDSRSRNPDDQVAAVKRTESLDQWTPRRDIMDMTPKLDNVSITPGVITGIDAIAQRLDTEYLGEKISLPSMAELRRRYRALDIEMVDGILRGAHVMTRVHVEIYPSEMVPGLEDYLEIAGFKKVTELLLALARAWRLEAYPRQQEEIRSMYVMLSRHLLDQGWAEGSGLGTLHHFGYFSRAWYPAVFLMREVLEEEQLLMPMSRACQWFTNVRRVLLPVEVRDADLDYWNTQAREQLVVLMTMPDTREKVALLQHYSAFLSGTVAMQTPGNHGGLKVDGTAFHHGGFYPAYAMGAFNRLANLFRLMDGTVFTLSSAAYDNLKQAMLMARLYGNPDWTIAISGRHPFDGSIAPLRGAFRDLALANRPDSPEPYDSELAAALLRLWPEEMENRRRLLGTTDPQPEADPAGSWTLNYAALGLTWINNRLITLKGYNRYVWNSEIYAQDNRYGRYQSYGSVLIMAPGGNHASGFSEPGWDWNRLPGTTTVHLPLDLLESPAQGTEMLRSPDTFAGAGDLDRRLGAFAVVLSQPERERFDASFRARKSVFSFKDYLVAMGSHIANESREHATETTLFQNALADPAKPVMLDGDRLTTFPLEVTATDGAHWLMDAVGNGYVVPGGQQLRVARQVQVSRHNKSREPTEGAFAVAWLNHGTAPRDAAYRYAILPGTDATRTAAFAATPPYEVLQQSSDVHAVRDLATGSAAAAFFTHGAGEPAMEVVTVDRPCLVITTPQSGGLLRVSVTDPDLNIAHNPGYFLTGSSLPTQVNLILRGGWRLPNPTPNVTLRPAGTMTRLEITCQHGRPVPFTLVRR